MLIRLRNLLSMKDHLVYPINIEKYETPNNLFLRRIENVSGDITFYTDISEKIYISYELEGTMICPDAYTLEDVEVPFELSDEEEVVFDENKEGFLIRGDSEDIDLVLEIIIPEVPIKVVKNKKIEYPRYDSCSFLSESDLEEKRVDPRLAKLKELIGDEEE